MTKGTLDFQNNESKIFDLMGNMIDNPNKLNDSTWTRGMKEHLKISKNKLFPFRFVKKIQKIKGFLTMYVDTFKLDEEIELLTLICSALLLRSKTGLFQLRSSKSFVKSFLVSSFNGIVRSLFPFPIILTIPFFR